LENTRNIQNLNGSKYGDLVLIVENVGENLSVKSKTPSNIVLEGVCAVFGEKNNNNRIYEKDEYLPHLSYLQDKIKKGQLIGDLDHPPQFDISLKSASHIIESLNYDGGNKVNIKLRILEDTPNGKIAKALINGGVNLSISSRAAGQVLNEGTVKLHRIFTYDLVGEPGFTEAILKEAVSESLKHDFQMITESYDALKAHSFFNNDQVVDISENFNYGENFKIYKINNNIESKVFENSIQAEKNKNTMPAQNEFVTKPAMEKYSNLVKDEFSKLRKEINKHKAILESVGTAGDSKVISFINYLAENLEGVINYSQYLSEMINNSVNYTEHVAQTTNNSIQYAGYLGEQLNKSIGYQNYISEKLNTAINHQDYIAEKLNETINYAEYLKENLNGSINYQNYIAEELDKGLQYTEYVAEGANNITEFANYLAESVNQNREYAQYIAERASQGIGYTEYLAEQLNEGNILVGGKRNLLSGVDKIVESIDKVIADVTADSSKAVLESRHPFLKVMKDENKEKFYKLDSKTKQAVVEALGASLWFNENDVLGIIDAVITESTKSIPALVKFMPAEYKPVWEKMNESEKARIFAKSQLYTLNSAYQVKAFWDEQDLRYVNERLEIETQNIGKEKEIQKLNESQSTEGMIPIERVVEQNRGYSSSYLDSIARGAGYRK
jgi:hypothetical protein